jgi:hypothetical protein
MSRRFSPNRRGPLECSSGIQLPDWAESLHSRAAAYFRNESPAVNSKLSHADMTATLACVVRAGLFMENADRQKKNLPSERSQSADMSLVTLSPPENYSSPAFQSPSSPQQLSTHSSPASAIARASPSMHFSAFSSTQSMPSSVAAHHRPSPSSIVFGDDESSTPNRAPPRMTPLSQSFTFSPQRSPFWTASDEAALQPLHRHPAHYVLLLDIFRNCWTSRIPGRLCLPSEEAAVLASFVQNYPLPAASAPDWEVSEFTGNVILKSLRASLIRAISHCTSQLCFLASFSSSSPHCLIT